MPRQLEAVFEHGVLRPLEPLALAEHQRVHLTLVERPDPPAAVEHRGAELQWLAKHAGPYAGQWVALDGPHLLAHGPRLAEVRAAALALGVKEPFFASIPDNDLPSGGW